MRHFVDGYPARGLQASTPISPGHADWALAEQRVLFVLLPDAETGVTLTQTFLMYPRKSLGMVVGLGKLRRQLCKISDLLSKY